MTLLFGWSVTLRDIEDVLIFSIVFVTYIPVFLVCCLMIIGGPQIVGKFLDNQWDLIRKESNIIGLSQ